MIGGSVNDLNKLVHFICFLVALLFCAFILKMVLYFEGITGSKRTLKGGLFG